MLSQGLFVEFGEIVMTKVVTDRNTKKSLGYGFVKFAREDDARTAIQKLNGFTVEHKCLKVSVARPPSLEIRNCKLYVTNLPREYSEQDVVALFKEVSVRTGLFG
jgi:RNA recognition motif-containing protein